jgi:hypothetical protein
MLRGALDIAAHRRWAAAKGRLVRTPSDQLVFLCEGTEHGIWFHDDAGFGASVGAGPCAVLGYYIQHMVIYIETHI